MNKMEYTAIMDSLFEMVKSSNCDDEREAYSDLLHCCTMNGEQRALEHINVWLSTEDSTLAEGDLNYKQACARAKSLFIK